MKLINFWASWKLWLRVEKFGQTKDLLGTFHDKGEVWTHQNTFIHLSIHFLSTSFGEKVSITADPNTPWCRTKSPGDGDISVLEKHASRMGQGKG